MFASLILLIIGLVWPIYMIALNRVGESFLSRLSGTFYTRFIYGARALRVYGVSIWGQYVDMYNERQLQLGASSVENINYFNIDCLYFYMPIVLGIIPTLYYFYWWFKALKTASIRRNFRYIMIFIIILVYSVSESALLKYTLPLVIYGIWARWEEASKYSGKEA